MSEPVTKNQLDNRIDGAVATLREDIRDVLRYLKESQTQQDGHLTRHDQRFDEIDVKLDAIMSMLATRKELLNLIRALKKQGIELDETEILTI